SWRRCRPGPPLFPYPTLFRSGRRRRPGSWAHGLRHPRRLLGEERRPRLDPLGRRLGRELLYLDLGRPTRVVVPDGVVLELVHERSEEHTSELQSRENLVCRLL